MATTPDLNGALRDSSPLPDSELIRASGLFDRALYEARVGAALEDPVAHYCSVGEAKGFAPSDFFDPNFYRLSNPDIAEASIGLFAHYLRHGRAEGRYPNIAALRGDAQKVRTSGLFSPPETRAVSRSVVGFPAIEQFLVGWRYGYRANDTFDDQFYARTYDDARSYGKPPFIHYLDIGRGQQRPVSEKQLAAIAALVESIFDRGHYVKQAGDDARADPLAHYLTVGRFRGFDPAPNFSLGYYLLANPDVAGEDPFVHFARERRPGRPDFEKNRIGGLKPYNPALPTVLIAVHAANRTGAPLVGLEMAQCFSRDHNVVVHSLQAGELIEEFAKAAIQIHVGFSNAAAPEYLLRHLKEKFALNGIILQSAETSAFAEAALQAGIPSVALIHEFAEYTYPFGRLSALVAAADRAVVPADLILKSVQKEVRKHFGAPANNILVRPQGIRPKAPPPTTADEQANLTADQILAWIKADKTRKPPIVLGAGFFHMRKGVELFVQTAHEVRRQIPDVRFVWAGPDYAPKADIGYSVWLAEAVRRLALEDTVFFLPQQSRIDEVLAISDVFFLSSRMDPFPSVVLESLEAGLQVVCFDQASGSAELFQSGLARGAVVEYANVVAAADALVSILRSDQAESSRINRALIEQRFQFSDYATFLKEQLQEARRLRELADQAVERIRGSKAFDANFYGGERTLPFETERLCRHYVSVSTKGLMKFHPRPGFCDGLYRSRTNLTQEAPLDHALRQASGAVPATHRCVNLRPAVLRGPFPLRIALHLHIFYPEVADEFLSQLNAAGLPIDLLITTTDADKQAGLEYVFSRYSHGGVDYIRVPNRGRDIGPLLSCLEAPIAEGGYGLVGHLHSKRSLDIDEAMGERWRHYLLGTLLGSDTLAHLFKLFIADEKLGLVFAEDRHACGWDGNLAIARDLAGRTNPPLQAPAYPYFPLGTMFWARPKALAPLWSLKLKTEDFPREPVATDGTMLHALERLLPASCEAAGFSWCTVHDPRCSW